MDCMSNNNNLVSSIMYLPSVLLFVMTTWIEIWAEARLLCLCNASLFLSRPVCPFFVP
jgi:hypothetical protein